MVGDSNDETNFPHKLLLTNKQISRTCKAFANSSSANIKIFKTKLSKMLQLGFIWFINPNLRGGNFTPCWFSFNNSETL